MLTNSVQFLGLGEVNPSLNAWAARNTKQAYRLTVMAIRFAQYSMTFLADISTAHPSVRKANKLLKKIIKRYAFSCLKHSNRAQADFKTFMRSNLRDLMRRMQRCVLELVVNERHFFNMRMAVQDGMYELMHPRCVIRQ